MTLPEWIEDGSILVDDCGYKYIASHSGEVDPWGNPTINLIDEDEQIVETLSRDMLEKRGYTLQEQEGESCQL